jgi:Mn-dependent DtxR family transcriptional regulator
MKQKRRNRGGMGNTNSQREIKYGRKKGEAFKRVIKHSALFEKFKRQEEDILKYIYEENGNKILISRLKDDFKNYNGDIESIISQLVNKDYVIMQNSYISLTSEGKEIAELIFRIHNEIEEYVKGKSLQCNTHQIAHILEHHLTEDQIQGMISASEYSDRGVPLPNFKLPTGTIVEVNLGDCKIWTKLISIGVFPGQKIHILNRTASNFLLEIKNSKFAIDSRLANGILLIP